MRLSLLKDDSDCPVLLAAAKAKPLKDVLTHFKQLNFTAHQEIAKKDAVGSETTLERWASEAMKNFYETKFGVMWDEHECSDALHTHVTSGDHYLDTENVVNQTRKGWPLGSIFFKFGQNEKNGHHLEDIFSNALSKYEDIALEAPRVWKKLLAKFAVADFDSDDEAEHPARILNDIPKIEEYLERMKECDDGIRLF